MKYDLKAIDYFLKNELKFIQDIEYHLLEKRNGLNLGIQNNRYGNLAEYIFLKKIRDKKYLKARLVVESISQLLSECDNLEADLLYYWGQLNMNYFQIHRKTRYSESSVKKKILKLRHRLVEIVNARSDGYE